MSTDHTGVTGTCDCCVGTRAATPQPVENRPGLDRVAYRSGTHGDFLASMLAGLSRSDRRALAALTTRDPDDPTIALLDAWAVTCDVLTFYNERLAHEAWLRTATERSTLQALGRLLAYRLAPGVAAETHLAFTLERPPVGSDSLGSDPGLVPPVTPAEVTLPERLRVPSIPGPGEQQQIFETVEAVTARPEWNSLPARTDVARAPVTGATSLWLDGVGLNLRVGDVLAIASTDDPGRRDLCALVAVEPDPPAGRTLVRWGAALGTGTAVDDPAGMPDVVVFRKRLALFGHQAPEWRAMNSSFRAGYAAVKGGTSDQPEWQAFDAPTIQIGIPPVAELRIDVDGRHPDISAGSWVALVRGGTATQDLYTVTSAAETSRSAFAVSGSVTEVGLLGPLHTWGTRRDTIVLAVPEALTVASGPDASTVSGAEIDVDGHTTGMATGRTVIVTGRTPAGDHAVEVATIASVSTNAHGGSTLTFPTPLANSYLRAGCAVYGNVARATHGETVEEVLGSGDAREVFPSFPLRQGPLTHVQAATEDGSASTLEIRVNEVRWRQRPSLFGSGPGERVYAVRVRPDGTAEVAFGDGATGARVPSGSLNVRATYRKGIGAAGNVAAGSLTQPLDRPLGLKAATNPLPATGGVDPEDETAARRAIPIGVRTLGRAVSLADYADLAMSFAGIHLARADVVALPAGRTIVVTATGPGNSTVADTTITNLTAVLRSAGNPHVDVLVLGHRAASFRLAAKVRVHPDHRPATVLRAVADTLEARYAAAARGLGDPVHRSQVIATAADVQGVAAVDLDRFYRAAPPTGGFWGRGDLGRWFGAFLPVDRLVAARAGMEPSGGARAAELLAIDTDPFDWLTELT